MNVDQLTNPAAATLPDILPNLAEIEDIINAVVSLFDDEFESTDEPDLALTEQGEESEKEDTSATQ